MNVRPITYQMFRSVFLQNDISLPSAYGITKGFLCQQPLRSNVAMAFMITTMGFIIAFPTLASAMSGYDANVGSYIPDYDQNFVPFSNFSQLLYVIHDGWRINETGKFWVVDNYTWPYYAYGYADPVLPAYEYSTCLTYGPDMGSFPPQCALAAAISNYTQQYGFGGRNNVSSTFNHSGIVTLDAPTLNIEAFAKAGDDKLRRLKPTDPILPQSWLKGNESYDITYVQENGSCQTIGDYQWGFSFLQLFICILLLLMWTVGTYILWLRAHFTFKLRGWDFNQVSGEHKAVLELAKAMQEDLDIKSSHCSLLIEKHLKERIDKELSGGSFSYSPAYPELKGYSFRRGTKTWIKQNIWWFVAIMASTVFCGVGWMAHAMVWIWNFGLWVGLLLAVCIGTSNGSRILITLFWSTLGVIGVIPLSIMMA